MKTTIKKMTAVIAGLALMLSATTSCKKGDTGPQGEKGATGATGAQGEAGPQAKTFNFSLTFSSTVNYGAFNGITGYDADDAILFYTKYETLSGTDYWAPLPVVLANTVNIIPEFSNTTGNVFINTLKANGQTGSPWTTTTTLAFKAVLIKSSQRLLNPTVNYNNYSEVKKVFNLKD